VTREPRRHQTAALEMLRDAFRRRKRRLMLNIATGGGKTFVAAMIIAEARKRDKRVLFIVDAVVLVDQTVEAFYGEGLYDIGVIQADHPMTDWSKPILVASVQTLRRRGMPKNVDIVIVDEAHCQDEWLKGIMISGEWADVPFIGLSATPWSKGLGHLYEELIIPISMQELIDQDLLCKFRVFAAAHPDLGSVKTLAGDYHEGQLAEVMSDGELVADIVTTWKRLGENRPTIAFCVDRAHAAKVQARFKAAGIGCGYIDSYTERSERLEIRRQLDRGEIKVVTSVGCLTKGVDWSIGCIILARPTKSEMLYVQMVGRGLRVNEGIPDCVILDHADNTLRLGFVTDIHHAELCKAVKGERKPQPEREAPLPKECPSCSFLKPPKTHECPSCGFKPEKRSEIEEKDGELVQLTRAKVKADHATKQDWYSQLRVIAQERRYSRGWVANTYKKKFGVWPRNLNENATKDPTQEVRNFVKYTAIQFAKRREAA
jgi:superfamily II DNA or RNA helicase